MKTVLRKISVAAASGLVALIAFLLYLSGGGRSDIPIEKPQISARIPTDVNDASVGTLGGADVQRVEAAVFTELDDHGEVRRRFGFDRLVRQDAGVWELDKPYMNIFNAGVKCYITSDRGTVAVQTIVGKPRLSSATLTDNVVVHIVPEEPGRFGEGYLYLDEVVFDDDKSMLSTTGPLRFVSPEAEMAGVGLEVIYNDDSDRMENLTISSLKYLRFKDAVARQGGGESPATAVPESPSSPPPAARRADGAGDRPVYRCIFAQNVTVETPENLLFTDELVVKGIGRENAEESAVQSAPATVPAEGAASPPVKAGPNGRDVVVKCDGPVRVLPMDRQYQPVSNGTWDVNSIDFGGLGDRGVLAAPRVEYNHRSSGAEVLADGPCRLKSFVDQAGAEPVRLPVEITCLRRARYDMGLGRVELTGQGRCVVLRPGQPASRRYILAGDVLNADIASGGLDRLVATGGTVRFEMVRIAGGVVVGGAKIKGLEFDYNPGQGVFEADGPGVVAFDNSSPEATETSARPGGQLSLQRPCYGVLRDFNRLRYLLTEKKLIVESGRSRMLIDYFPVEGQDPGQGQVSVTAGHIEADIVDKPDGGVDMENLVASDGFSYQRDKVQFEGSQMTFDNRLGVIRASGNDSYPAMLNGTPVDAIEYDIQTGRAGTRITGHGIIPVN